MSASIIIEKSPSRDSSKSFLVDVIQVTDSTDAVLKDTYQFEDRGLITIKGKGEMRTYLLKGQN